jgi:hypothetical protein
MSQHAIHILEDDTRLQTFRTHAAAHALSFDIGNIIPIYEKLYDDVLTEVAVH